MLKTHKEYVYDSIPETPVAEYRVSINDVIQFRLYANDGFKIIDLASGTSAGTTNASANAVSRGSFISYLVQENGAVRLPIIDEVVILGLTKEEAESVLEEAYSAYYKQPYVQLEITNKRVIIFTGNGGNASVIPLTNTNTTLMEAVALQVE
jgi:polysaccharide export outer membrane protein